MIKIFLTRLHNLFQAVKGIFRFNPKQFFSNLKKYPWRKTALSLKFLPKVLSKVEKLIILMLLVAVIFSTSKLAYSSWKGSTKEIPAAGGELIEGVVGEPKELEKQDARLINAGLTRYDSQKNVVPDLASSWEINDDGKTYIFHLREGFNANDLLNQINIKNVWGDIDISVIDDNTLKFSFRQPFSPFLNVSTEPIFSYGPYQIFKETKDQIEFSARNDYYGGKPFINKVILKFYRSEKDLLRAARRGDIQAYSCPQADAQSDGFNQMVMTLPRDLDLFYNLNNKDLQDINIRKALRDGTSPNKNLNLRLVTSDNPKNLEFARKLKVKWEQIGVNINLDVKDNITLQKNIIPKRDYDLLLYGLDYGEDPDPYPFWHSSQIKEDGKNLSNYKNTDSDKLLEKARQELDPQKRAEDYAQFQKAIDEQVPMFVVENQNYCYSLSNDIKGANQITGTTEADRFLNIANWYIKTKRAK